MSSNKMICPRCNGKGKAKLKDVDTFVNCPSCNGTGYLNNDFLQENSNTENKLLQSETEKIKKINQHKELNKDEQILILKQIIKNSDLFLNGIKLLYQDKNKEIFIYLQNQNIFEIENQIDCVLIKLRPEFKNSLAKQCIDYLTKNKYLKN